MGTRRGSDTLLDRQHGRHSLDTLTPLLVIAAAVAVYFNSFDGAFVFDDKRYIIRNARIGELWPPWEALSGRRPVLDLSLAINYAFSELKVAGYHAFNLLIHILAGLTLYGIVRRTLLHEPFANRFGRSSAPLALVVALLWTVHPLQTQSVTYLIQRSESMMGLFYLLTLYCVIRGTDSFRGVWWYGAAVVWCVLGMGSKGVMVTAPVVVLLYDRVFLSKSFAETFRRRWGLYVGLAATWGVLWACGIAHGVLSPSKKVATVGFSFKEITPLEYALTQFGVLVEYLKLSLWPHPLCLDYAWPVERTAEGVIIPAILIVALLTGTVWALFRKPWLGFLGAWFFLILAPTSSFIPIRDPLFEHRMYLSLAAVVILIVVGAHQGLQRVAIHLSPTRVKSTSVSVALVVAAVALLGYGTVRRNKDYDSPAVMWRDVVARRPQNTRARYNLGTTLLEQNEVSEAVAAFEEALRTDPRSTETLYNLGKALALQGKVAAAAQRFIEALQIDPGLPGAHNDLGNIRARAGRFDEAIAHYREAIRSDPGYVQAHFNLGDVLLSQGKTEEAVEALHRAVRLSPETARIHYLLGNAYLRQGKLDEAGIEYRETLRLDPNHARAHQGLGTTLLEQNRLNEAIAIFEQALRIDPRSAQALYNFGKALSQQGQLAAAAQRFAEALQIDPRMAEAHNDLGNILVRWGRFEEAIAHYREAIRFKPRYVQAYYNLGSILLNQDYTDEAVEVLRRAVRLSPETARIHYLLGSAYNKQGKIDKAVTEYKETLRLDPDHARARQALEAMEAESSSADQP